MAFGKPDYAISIKTKRLCLRHFRNLEIYTFEAGLMVANKHLFHFGSFAIRDGSEIRFWEEKWLANGNLREQYPTLYRIVRQERYSCAGAHLIPFGYFFQTGPGRPSLLSWHNLLSRLDSVNLRQGRDVYRDLTTSRSFIVDSMYHALMHSKIQWIIINKIGK